MPLTQAQYAKRLLQQQKSQQRQREKQLNRRNDPAYQQEQREKQLASQQRQQDKQRQKQNDPEYQAQQKAKKLQALEKSRLKAVNSAKKPSQIKSSTIKPIKSKPIKSKGLKGRTHTAEEKRLANKLADIGCICCLNQGWTQSHEHVHTGQHFISLHHVEGRIKQWAHAKVLPLCHFHHQSPAPEDAPKELFPLHGNAKPIWEKVNGTQTALLKQVYAMIGELRPWLKNEKAISA